MLIRLVLAVTFFPSLLAHSTWGQALPIDIEGPPLKYSETKADNRVSRLLDRIATGDIQLEYDRTYGNLRALLKNLDISERSQVLVFSKTSMQVQHISPRNPRAIYFNDDTYVGWIRGSPLIEISTADQNLGAAFYTVQMSPRQPPHILQETYQCLACHATSLTQGIPGHTVRSGYPSYDGQFAVQRESFVTDESSDFRQRWGGWYVTGMHGDLQHMGNTYLRAGVLDKTLNGNLPSLTDLFDTRGYLTEHSDIQALMVLEHQTQLYNAFTRADFTVRVLQHEQPDQDEAERAIVLKMIAKNVVDRLLFSNEFQLTTPISGTSGFDKMFLKLGPKDSKGRSLREFDMQTRMFKYPLSYLIYSDAFDALQPILLQELRRQLKEVLEGSHPSQEYPLLTPDLRHDIFEIVQATKPSLLR